MKISQILSCISFQNKNINVLYFNDLHGSTKNLKSFSDAQDKYYIVHDNEINYTLCGGDMFLEKGENDKKTAKILSSRIDASAVGNHDLVSEKFLNYLINKYKMKNKWVSANLHFEKKTPLNNNIKKSVIIEKSGEKIGVIGLSPLDYKNIAFMNSDNDFVNVQSFDETILSVKKEVEKLEKKGINKIFLLAHTGEYGKNGENYYREFSKIGGIDVIIGGHDHIEANKWRVSERGEPVKIVATGKSNTQGFKENLDVFGILNLEFDDNGVLVKNKSRNRFVKIKDNKNDIPMQNSGGGQILSVLSKPLTSSNPLTNHNEAANLVADSNLWYVNKYTKGEKADFAFVNAGTIRGNFDNINIKKEDIANVVPFITSTLIKAPLTKKQIINTLNWCALSTSFGKISPGLMQVSGMEYTVKPDLTVKNVHILNSDGTVKYNLDDCDDNKKFICVYDVFLATGVAGLKDLKTDCENNENVEHFNVSRQSALEEYLRNGNISNYENNRIFIQ